MKTPLLLSILMFLGLMANEKTFCQAELEIEISEIRSEKGHILMSLYDHPEQFPRNPKPGFGGIIIKKEGIRNNTLKHTIKDMKPGKYAISFLDDENKSGDMDFTRLGIPTEGFGFSNNVKPFLSAPPFEKCLFEIRNGKNTIKLEVQYRK